MIPLQTFLDDTDFGHCDLQMDRFITVKSGGTLFGCYHQACREVSTRVNAIIDARSQLDLLRVRRAEARHRLLTCADRFKRHRLKIKLRQFRWGIAQTSRQLRLSQREFLRFYGQCAALYRALGFDVERPTPERLSQLHAERWEYLTRAAIAGELFTQGRPSRQTMDLLQSLPPEMRKRIGKQCVAGEEAQRACMQWWLDYEPELPDPLTLTDEESREVLACCESSGSSGRLPNLSRTDAKRLTDSSTKTA